MLMGHLFSRNNERFWTAPASPKNALSLFDTWASDLAEIEPDLPHTGVPLFRHDPRPTHAATFLGQHDRLDGMNVLELGPLEGAHSFQLEQLGAAAITAIESNADAFIKCLIIKNLLRLDRTTFLLGDCLPFLQSTTAQYDLIFASGILYHMESPLELIRLLGQHTKRVFLWTMYYDGTFAFPNGTRLPHTKSQIEYDGRNYRVFKVVNSGRNKAGFWGGNRLTSCWLELDTIIEAFRNYGFTNVHVLDSTLSGGYGPSATIAFSKPDLQ